MREGLKLLGYRTDIKELLWCSNLFVFPSLQESLPVALYLWRRLSLRCHASQAIYVATGAAVGGVNPVGAHTHLPQDGAIGLHRVGGDVGAPADHARERLPHVVGAELVVRGLS